MFPREHHYMNFKNRKLMRTKIIYCLLFISACNNKTKITEETNSNLKIINLEDSNKTKETDFNNIFSISKIIKLQSDSISLLSDITKISTNDSLIFLFDKEYSSLKVFDLNGKYRYQIGRIGEGKGEFIKLNDFYLDTKNDQILLYTNYGKSILKYTTKGEFIEKISVPFFAYYMTQLNANENIFYTNFNTSKESEQNNLLITDSNCKIIKRWASYKDPDTQRFANYGFIQKNEEGVLVNKAFSDTIYQILQNKNIKAKYYILNTNSGSDKWESLANTKKLNFEKTKNWTTIQSGFIETKNIFSFLVVENTRLNKYFYLKDKEKVVSDKNYKNSYIKYFKQPSGFDGDNLISSLNMTHFFAIRSERTLELLKKENYDLFTTLSSLKETDNPVIIFYKPE